jgi:UrcA family protein
MLRMIIAAAVVLVPSAASATSTITLSKDGTTASVSYRDLNLASRTDRAELTGRIRRAADQLCLEDFNSTPLTAAPERAECFRNAVASGVGRMEEIASRQAG